MINPVEIAKSITTRYIFDISRHCKIWFSVDPEQGLGLENELHLFQFRKDNPNFVLTLIYSGECLSPSSILKLEQFCLNLQIRLVKFEDLEARLQEPTDRDLFAIAKAEIDHAKHFSEQGGNMASAADAVREMRYVIEAYGNYQDFDVTILLSQLNTRYVELKGPILFSTEVVDLGDYYQVLSNSDFLAFSLDKDLYHLSSEAWKGLKACQQEIIAHYSGTFVFEKLSHGQLPKDFSEKYPELPAVLADFYAQYPDKRTVFDFRKYLSSLPAFTLDAGRTETFASYFLRLSVVAMSGPTNTLHYFQHLFPSGQTYIPIFIPKKELKKRWLPFISAFIASGIGFYDPIYAAIKSKNTMRAALQEACLEKPSALCHQSWTKAGNAAKRKREQNLYQNAEIILGFWRRHSVGKEHVIERHLALCLKKICTVETILNAVAEKKYSLALRKACWGLQLPVVKLLLQSGINLEINELTSKNQTALDLVQTAKGNKQVKEQIEVLIKAEGGMTAQALEKSARFPIRVNASKF